MQNLFKYRLLVVLFLFCGMFLIVSVANTVKRSSVEDQGIQVNESGLSFDSVPGEKPKETDTSLKRQKDTLHINGKSWRMDNELHIMY